MTDIVLDAAGFIVRAPGDVGVRMRPAAPGIEYQHPEDAYADGPLRGDYVGRIQPRIHHRRGRRNSFGEFEPNPRSGGI